MTPSEFSYRDKKLGDAEAITVATTADVFYPTSTTVLLLRAARGALGEPCQSVLDIGCGSGVVAVVLARLLPPGTSVCASDLSPAAVRLASANAERNGVRVDCRCGSSFDPWKGQRFDLIVDDVAGVAEPLDRLSGWYPPGVPSEAGRDGARWILDILERAPDHLTPGGRIVFPILDALTGGPDPGAGSRPVRRRDAGRGAVVPLQRCAGGADAARRGTCS